MHGADEFGHGEVIYVTKHDNKAIQENDQTMSA
jgi:hypothetical protein